MRDISLQRGWGGARRRGPKAIATQTHRQSRQVESVVSRSRDEERPDGSTLAIQIGICFRSLALVFVPRALTEPGLLVA